MFFGVRYIRSRRFRLRCGIVITAAGQQHNCKASDDQQNNQSAHDCSQRRIHLFFCGWLTSLLLRLFGTRVGGFGSTACCGAVWAWTFLSSGRIVDVPDGGAGTAFDHRHRRGNIQRGVAARARGAADRHNRNLFEGAGNGVTSAYRPQSVRPQSINVRCRTFSSFPFWLPLHRTDV